MSRACWNHCCIHHLKRKITLSIKNPRGSVWSLIFLVLSAFLRAQNEILEDRPIWNIELPFPIWLQKILSTTANSVLLSTKKMRYWLLTPRDIYSAVCLLIVTRALFWLQAGNSISLTYNSTRPCWTPAGVTLREKSNGRSRHLSTSPWSFLPVPGISLCIS